MTALTRPSLVLAAIGLSASLLQGCDSGSSAARDDEGAPTAGETVATSRPHFTGGRDVAVVTGRIVYSDEPCADDPDDDRVCEPDDAREYLLLSQPASARLVEARMDPSDGNTAWTARITFAPESRERVVAAREEARATGGVVLVLDEAEEVLLMATVPRVEGRSIVFPELTKPEAWALVERFVDG